MDHTSDLESLYRSHHDRVRSYAVRRIGPDQVDDVVAATFAVAWRRMAELPPTEPARTWWLFRTVHYVTLNVQRAEERVRALQQRIDEGQLRPLADAADEHLEGHLEPYLVEALMELSPKDRYVLIASVWEEHTAAELAAALGCSPGAARTRLSRARTKLRRLLHRGPLEDG